MAELSYLVRTLYDAKVFDEEPASESEINKLSSLLLMDDVDEKIMDSSRLAELIKTGDVLDECSIFYGNEYGIIAVDDADDTVTVKDIYMMGKPGKEMALIFQALLTVVQNPVMGKKVLKFDIEDELESLVEDMMEGASSGEVMDVNPMLDYVTEEELANIDTYNYDIRFKNVLDELDKGSLNYRYEYEDYVIPRLYVKAGEEEICFIYSKVYEGNLCVGYEMTAYSCEKSGDKDVLIEPIAVIEEGLSPETERIVYEIERIIQS